MDEWRNTVLPGTSLVQFELSSGVKHVFRALLGTVLMENYISQNTAQLFNAPCSKQFLGISDLAHTP